MCTNFFHSTKLSSTLSQYYLSYSQKKICRCFSNSSALSISTSSGDHTLPSKRNRYFRPCKTFPSTNKTDSVNYLVSHFGSTDDESSIKLLKKALDIGCTFWDTAEIYGVGHSEEVISHVIKDRRKDVFLATKFGVYHRDGKMVADGNPENVFGLRTLSETIGPIETTVGAMAELVKQGKVRYLGISECSAQTLRRAHKVHPITAVQMEYSPWTLDHEKDDLITACRELGVSIVAYSPLGKGFLTGQIRKFEDLEESDWRRTNPRFQPENFKINLVLADKIKEIADKKGVLPSQLALAWDLAQGDDMFVIPGTRKEKNLIENFAANEVELTEEEKRSIRNIAESFQVAGERYAPEALAMVGL